MGLFLEGYLGSVWNSVTDAFEAMHIVQKDVPVCGLYATVSPPPPILEVIFQNISFYAKNKHILPNFLLCKTGA